MHVLILGGSGDMGRRALLELAAERTVKAITVAGRDEGKGRAVLASVQRAQKEITAAAAREASSLNPPLPQLSWATVDAVDEAAVIALMARHDVTLSALGPFYLFERPLVQAAIAAGTHYISLCDDSDAVEAVLPLDAAARAADITVLTGIGWTPGLTNLVARHAGNHLDSTDEVHMAWAARLTGHVGEAVILHTLHVFSGEAAAYYGGAPTSVTAGSDPQRLPFPQPLGPVTVRHVGHPETVTLPRFWPGLKTVTLKGGLSEDLLNWLAMAIGRLNLASTHGRRRALLPILKATVPLLKNVAAPPTDLSGLSVTVKGRRRGEPATIVGSALAPMDALTAVPAAMAVLWLGEGKIKRRGVFAPEAEGGIDPEPFLNEAAKRGIQFFWQGP